VRFEIEQRFEASLDEVESAFVDPSFLEALAALPKLGEPRLVEQRIDGDLVHQQVAYAFAGQLSSAVTAVIDPARLTWIEDSTLDRSTHRTTFRILPDHYTNRLKASGTFTLRDLGGGTTLRRAEGDLKVSFPLVGGKVERAIVSGLTEHAALEVEVFHQWRKSTG
jgi:hypothetical protein